MRKNSPAKEAHGRCPDGDGHLPKITTYTCVFVMGVCLCVFVCLCMAVARSWCVTCSNLCIAYQNTGQVDKALTLLKRVLQRRKQLFGEPHPKVANTLCTLSSLCVCVALPKAPCGGTVSRLLLFVVAARSRQAHRRWRCGVCSCVRWLW